MQRLYVDRRCCRCRAPSPENITSPTLELRLPRRNLIGVNIEMLCQLSQRSIALDGGECHLGLECRCVVPALSSAHSLSCSRPSSPLSGRNSTYRPVQICESSSKCGVFRRIGNKNTLPGSHEKPLPANHKRTTLMGVG